MASRSRREHKPTSKFLSYFTQELSPASENGGKNKTTLRSKNSTTFKSTTTESAKSIKRKFDDGNDIQVVSHVKQDSSSETRRSNRAQKLNPKFNGFIQPGKSNKKEQNQIENVTVNLWAKPRPKNAVTACVEAPKKRSNNVKVDLDDCFEGLTNDLALIRRQTDSNDNSKAINKTSGNIVRSTYGQPRAKFAQSKSTISSRPTSKNTNSSMSESSTLSLRSHGKRIAGNRKSFHLKINQSTSSNEKTQNVVKQLLSGETLKYVRPNPVVVMPRNLPVTKKVIVNKEGVKYAVKRPIVANWEPASKHRKLEMSLNRSSARANISTRKLRDEATMSDSVRKLWNQRNVRCKSITVTRKQYPLRKPSITTVTLSSDNVNSPSSSNSTSPNSPPRPKPAPKQRLLKAKRINHCANKADKRVPEIKEQELEEVKVKETLKKFLIMGTKVANAISETLKHNEETLLAKSSVFEKKCLNLVHSLARQGEDLEEHDMEKVLQLLDEEQEERQQYRHTFLESLKVSHLTNMALYSQMLRLLKTL